MRYLTRNGVFLFGLMVVVLAIFVLPKPTSLMTEEMAYSEFAQHVEQGDIASVVVSGQGLKGETTDGETFKTTAPQDVSTVYKLLEEHQIATEYEVVGGESIWLSALFTFVPLIVIVGLFFWFMRNIQGSNGRAMSFGKSKAKLQTDGGKRITFEDVAGIDESKEELQEIIDFLKDPRKFTRLGARIPKGVLLMGRPGTGKTLLGRAVAGEAGVPFFSISGSDFVEMFVGVGASRVRDLFEQGKKHAPCIIFIDEIDAVGRHRGGGHGGGHDEREQTLNQLLVEMDGFEGTEGVIIMAATNRPDVLDPALLRPGRFDRRVTVPAPDVRGREAILAIHTRRMPVDEAVDLSLIAKGTPGCSGADLENLCNEAALLAARKNKKQVDQSDFQAALEKIFMGPERRSMVMPESEKRTTAYHEAGHAIVAYMLPGHDPVHKITIVPRGRALGLTWMLPDEDRISQTKKGMLKQITVLLGGRAAEAIALDAITGGASNDIERATKMSHRMVCELGMSDELGPVAWGESGPETFLGQMQRSKSYSEATSQAIDNEVKAMVTRGYELARTILTLNMHVLHSVAQSLVEVETLDRAEFEALVVQAGPITAPNDPVWAF